MAPIRSLLLGAAYKLVARVQMDAWPKITATAQR